MNLISKVVTLLVIISAFIVKTNAQVYKSAEPLAHTYSIVAYDEATGEMGVAVQSHWFQVGPLVAWGEAGVGVVATQSFVNPAHGPNGLKLMSMGISADKALAILMEEDEGRDVRQVAFLDASGKAAAYTGSRCIQAAGHHKGKNYSVQANMMTEDAVWPAMSKAFESSTGPLAGRLIEALKAAEAAGGDIRGKQSAALLVVAAENTDRPWIDRLVDLRVDDHADPLGELERLYLIHTAYNYMNDGDLAVEKNDLAAAEIAYGKAMKLNPHNEEMKYWYAVSLVNSGYLDKALPLFKAVFDKNENWRILTPRLIDNGLLLVDAQQLKKIIEL